MRLRIFFLFFKVKTLQFILLFFLHIKIYLENIIIRSQSGGCQQPHLNNNCWPVSGVRSPTKNSNDLAKLVIGLI